MQKAAVILLTILIFYVNNAAAQTNKLSVSKEPEWITKNSISFNNRALENEAEDGYLDIVFEKQVSLKEQSKYFKKSFKILSESGVENNSEISVEYDPLYEHVLLHEIKIIRDGNSINRLELSKFKIIQQESDLKAHLYNGTLTALLLLEDVRKGDIIEYSYTIKGFNPIFDNKYCDVLQTGFSVPVNYLYYKIITDENKTINIKYGDNAKRQNVSHTKYGKEYEWKLTALEPLRIEKKIPSWYEPFPMIYVSEYNSWAEVNKWALNLFPVNVQLSLPLQEKINSISSANSSNESRMLAALHFVQDEVRYMGIEMGASSHKPANPNKIFAQRFGDCKDKSYLLCTMLRALGVEANPVLINTSSKKNINEWLPSNKAFDHATVTANLDGKTYFFDPTISLQRGSLKNIVYPDYETGLIITDTSRALTTISSRDKGNAEVKETFDIDDMSGKAKLKVVTRYSGFYADNNRNDFNDNSIYEIKKKYRDFYANYYEKITADSLSYSNDDNTGDFITTEYYTILNLWKTEKGETISATAFAPFIINSVLSKPDNQKRVMPYSLNYPTNYTEDIEINLPQQWSLDIREKMVQCGYFNISSKGSYSDKQIRLHYEYETLKDHIPADEMENYQRNFEAAADICRGWNLTLNSSISYSNGFSTSSGNTGNIFPQLYVILGLFVLLTILIKRKNRQNQ